MSPENLSNRKHQTSVRQKSSPAHNRLRATYIRSNLTRVVHADGVYGGPTTKGLIYMAFFSEHNKLPDTVQFEIDEIERRVKQVTDAPAGNDFIREVEVEVIINPGFARSLVNWLQDKIKAIEKGGEELQGE